MRSKILAVVVATSGLTAYGQLTVDNTLTPDYLVQNVLLGSGVTVSNITFNGVPGTVSNPQIGAFDGSACNVGIANGIVLGTGDVTAAIGPNNQGGAALGGGFWGNGDPDLLLLAGDTIRDAAVLEFDFIPSGDSISFSFVFGSDEYLEFVGSFNDAFGFFLSGPGISGPYTGGAINIALVPGTSTPVTINNVNSTVNPAYYVDNGDGFTPPMNTDPFYIQYDGFTTVMVASALVQCGQTYHIKIAIGDAIDTAWDSGVFLEGGSFNSPNEIDLEVVTASADGSLTEGCTDAVFIITRPTTDDSLEVTVVVSGTATNGTDFTSIPPVITIPADSSSVSFPISAFEDGIPEGVETIILTATYVNACGDTSVSSVTVPINEYVPIVLSTQDLQLECPEEDVPVIAEASGGFGICRSAGAPGPPALRSWYPATRTGSTR